MARTDTLAWQRVGDTLFVHTSEGDFEIRANTLYLKSHTTGYRWKRVHEYANVADAKVAAESMYTEMRRLYAQFRRQTMRKNPAAREGKLIEIAQLAGQIGWYVFVDGMLDADFPATSTPEQAVGLALAEYANAGKLKREFTGDGKTAGYNYRAKLPTRIGEMSDPVYANIVRHRETGEWVVRLYLAGKHYKPADYFTNDATDAKATALDMVNRQLTHNEKNMARVRKNPAFVHRGKKKGNTRTESNDAGIIVQYHNTVIAILRPDGRVTLNSGGYETVSTKRRMNQTFDNWGLPLRVEQTKHKWFVRNIQTGKQIAFFDYVTFDPQTMTADSMNKNPRRITGTLEMVRRAASSRVKRKRAMELGAKRSGRLYLDKQTGATVWQPPNKHVHVQQQRGAMWFTLAVAPNNDSGRVKAKNWAIAYHRKHPASKLRLFV